MWFKKKPKKPDKEDWLKNDYSILDSQKRDLLQAISCTDFELTDFEFINKGFRFEWKFNYIDTICLTKVVYKHQQKTQRVPDGYYFMFDYEYRYEGTPSPYKRVSTYSPGTDYSNEQQTSSSMNWQNHLCIFNRWLKNLRREVG